jgi:hypothetical protein
MGSFRQFTFGYLGRTERNQDNERPSLRQMEISAPTLAEAVAAYTRWAQLQNLPDRPHRGWLDGLAVYSFQNIDFDKVMGAGQYATKTNGERQCVWTAPKVAAAFLDTTVSQAAQWGGGIAIEVNDRTVAWTTMRAMLHLEELAIAVRVDADRWQPGAPSAHDRLALPAALHAIHARDAAIRGNA